jgi:hypothetical protein
MNESPPLDFQVAEQAPGEVRCTLPCRPPRLGLVLLGFGILGPVVLGAFVLWTAPMRLPVGFPPLLPLVLFALVLTGMGLWLAAGHVIIEIRGTTLRSVACLGPLKWSRSVPINRIRRFLVQEITGKAEHAAAPSRLKVPTDLAVLQADVAGGKPVALAVFYPRDLLQRLADELSRRCEVLRVEPPSLEGREASPEQQAAHADALRADKPAAAVAPGSPADDLPTVPAATLSGKPGGTLPFRLATGEDHPGCALVYTFFFMVAWWAFIGFWGLGLRQAHRQGPQAWAILPAGMQRWLWVQTIFFIPFALAGLWLVGSFLWQAYRAFGRRRVRVEVSAQPLHPGERFELSVWQAGPLQLYNLRVLLVCQEEASCGEGPEAHTETQRAAEVEIVREEAFAIASDFPYEARRAARVPARAMHSFEAKHNKVRWLVVVAGKTTGGRSFEHTFSLVVHPRPGSGGGHE